MRQPGMKSRKKQKTHFFAFEHRACFQPTLYSRRILGLTSTIFNNNLPPITTNDPIRGMLAHKFRGIGRHNQCPVFIYMIILLIHAKKENVAICIHWGKFYIYLKSSKFSKILLTFYLYFFHFSFFLCLPDLPDQNTHKKKIQRQQIVPEKNKRFILTVGEERIVELKYLEVVIGGEGNLRIRDLSPKTSTNDASLSTSGTKP